MPDQLDLLRIPRCRLDGFFITILLFSSIPPVDPFFQLPAMLPLEEFALASTPSLPYIRLVALPNDPEFPLDLDWAGPAPAHAWNPEESPLADMDVPAGMLAALPGSPPAGFTLRGP